MRIETALKHRKALATRVKDIYSMAIICGMTSDEMNQAIMKAYTELPAKTPQWVRTYVDGLRECLQDSLYADCLVFGGYIGDRFYSTYRWRDDYYEKHGIEPSEFTDNGKVTKRGHYWRESIRWHNGVYNRDTVKPYFIGE